MFNKIKIITLGVVLMAQAMIASGSAEYNLGRVNELLGEGVKQSVSKLTESGGDQFLPFMYMIGSNAINRQAGYGDEKAFDSIENYREAINELVTIVSVANKQDALDGYLLFASSSVKGEEGKDVFGITVFIEAKDIKARQLFYPFKRDAGNLSVGNPVEMVYKALVFK